jgi:PKD repeat protein
MKSLSVLVLAILIPAILVTGCTNQPGSSQPVTTAPQTLTPVQVTSISTPCQICNPVNTTTVPTPSIPVTVTVPTQSPQTTRGTGTIPNAQFTATPVSGKVPLEVSFTDLTIGSPDNWSWSFGDGNTSDAENPTYVYSIPGTYTVRLVASNSAGRDSETKAYYIMANPAFHSPGAAYDVIPPTATQPTTVVFLDRSSGPPTSWDWDFGDGGTSDLQNPVHTYSGPGVYLVSLNVSNDAGFGVVSGYISI